MLVYNTTQGIILNHNNAFYCIEKQWHDFINNDKVLEDTLTLLSTLIPITEWDKNSITIPMSDNQELWACGVTYYRSMVGRQEESKDSGGADFYAKVYDAERPECFFKATAHRVVANNKKVRIRKDSTWNVPEPELTLVVTTSGKIVGYTIGNDMSSRSIEGENPLYLPQAKTYDGCASLGPCIYLTDCFLPTDTVISITINRNDTIVFENSITIDQMKRTPEELVSYVYKECSFPNGCLIMTGTGIVPENEFTLQKGDIVSIAISRIGTLINEVA